MFAMGTKVRAGWPRSGRAAGRRTSCREPTAEPSAQGNLKVPTDFRSVY